MMIVDGGVVVDAWGDITRRFQCHSMRKSMMSALIGVHVDEGSIDLSKTTANHSKRGIDGCYGYMWWTGVNRGLLANVNVKEHCYFAAGWGGHRVFVLPYRKS